MTAAKLLILAFIVASASAEPAVAKVLSQQECSELAIITKPVSSAIVEAAKSTQGLDWNLIINNSSGDLQTSAKIADKKKLLAVNAMLEYRSAIEDVIAKTYECKP